MNIEINIPLQLKIIRNAHKCSARQLANAVGIKLGTYQAYEQGRAEPAILLLVKIANYYRCTLNELIGLETREPGILEKQYRASSVEARRIVDYILGMDNEQL